METVVLRVLEIEIKYLGTVFGYEYKKCGPLFLAGDGSKE